MSETNCKDVLAEIEVYLDNELGDSGRCEQIRAHLDACSPCMERAEFRAGLKDLIAKKCGCQEIPDSLVERVVKSLGTEPVG